jgi:hypothetical protein
MNEAGLQQAKSESEREQETGGKDEAAGSKAGEEEAAEPIETSITLAYQAAKRADDLKQTLGNWFEYYIGYDPMFTWWVTDPYKKVDKTLEDYIKFLREKIIGFEEGEDPRLWAVRSEGRRFSAIWKMR